ncbi:hypothetical protein E2C01_097884 [Portunus trituberculatus]|uniref:Uncharacterized protein n=1 Tax=Portunus trituberculatus TaxID=210409 RepID=A0A5B7KAQ3_PORTR|nr:hypothetical protein [Portunus trituberculatus]
MHKTQKIKQNTIHVKTSYLCVYKVFYFFFCFKSVKLMKTSQYKEIKVKVTKTCYFSSFQLLLHQNTEMQAKHIICLRN